LKPKRAELGDMSPAPVSAHPLDEGREGRRRKSWERKGRFGRDEGDALLGPFGRHDKERREWSTRGWSGCR
jgi:hypothetical protein